MLHRKKLIQNYSFSLLRVLVLLLPTLGPSINDVGNFSGNFDTPLPHVGSFLVLSVGNFDQILTPPNCRRRLWMAPLAIVPGLQTQLLALSLRPMHKGKPIKKNLHLLNLTVDFEFCIFKTCCWRSSDQKEIFCTTATCKNTIV